MRSYLSHIVPHSKNYVEKTVAAQKLATIIYTPETVRAVEEEAWNKHDLRVLADKEYTDQVL